MDGNGHREYHGPPPRVRLTVDMPPELADWLTREASGPRRRNAFIVAILTATMAAKLHGHAILDVVHDATLEAEQDEAGDGG